MPFDGSGYSYETVAQRMLAFFENGDRWQRGMYGGAHTCLLGAFNYVIRGHINYPDDAVKRTVSFRLLAQACGDKRSAPTERYIMSCNDQANTYRVIAKVLRKMHDLEMEALVSGRAKPAPVPPIHRPHAATGTVLVAA